jgi:hypothetical protein
MDFTFALILLAVAAIVLGLIFNAKKIYAIISVLAGLALAHYLSA